MATEMPKSLYEYLTKPDEMGRPEEPITKGDLTAFEASRNVVLPDDYKDYCIRYGARTLQNREIFCFKSKVSFPNGKSKNVSVSSISGPPYISENHDIYMRPVYNNSGPRLPEKHFPFTFDSGYGHCLMDLTEEGAGRIRYIVVKAKTFGEAGYGWDQIGTVSDSFSGFLAGLKPDYL